MDKKKTILIDLDGVLNDYDGHFDSKVIPYPRKNTKIFLEKLIKNYNLLLFTTRNKLLTAKWLIEHDLDKYFVDITNVKSLAWLMIDDRCIKYEGDYDLLLRKINEFEPWYNEHKY